MKIQSAGRLGNTLFIWAFAIYLSKEKNAKVSIFTDKIHSHVGTEASETMKLLSLPNVRFYNSDLNGVILSGIDWLTSKSQVLGNIIKKFLGVSDESELITKRTRILRGFFQNSDYVMSNREFILEKLLYATNSVEQKSTKVQELKLKYSNYQVIHLRFGDFKNSEFGVVSPQSFGSIIDPKMPTLVCTDGSQNEILGNINFPYEEILTPSTLNTWETLCLMQGASRFIGVNSTLSWWGAFLVLSMGNSAFLPEKWKKSGDLKDSNLLNLDGCVKYEAKFI